jgi:hypothetical protein
VAAVPMHGWRSRRGQYLAMVRRPRWSWRAIFRNNCFSTQCRR